MADKVWKWVKKTDGKVGNFIMANVWELSHTSFRQIKNCKLFTVNKIISYK